MEKKTACKAAAAGALALALAAAWAGSALLPGGGGGAGGAAGETTAAQEAGGLAADDVRGLARSKALKGDDALLTKALAALSQAAAGDSSLAVARDDGDKVYVTGSLACYEVDLSGSEPTASRLTREVEGVNEGEFTEAEERAEENLRASEEQARQEEAEEEQAKAAAAAASTRIKLSDGPSLEAAGLPTAAAKSLWGSLGKWCGKKGLDPDPTCKADRLEVAGKRATGTLSATKALDGGEKSVGIAAAWDGSKWSFTAED